MKVKIEFTVDVDDDARLAINHHYGRPGLADREGVRSFYEAHGTSSGEIMLGDEWTTIRSERGEPQWEIEEG